MNKDQKKIFQNLDLTEADVQKQIDKIKIQKNNLS